MTEQHRVATAKSFKSSAVWLQVCDIKCGCAGSPFTHDRMLKQSFLIYWSKCAAQNRTLMKPSSIKQHAKKLLALCSQAIRGTSGGSCSVTRATAEWLADWRCDKCGHGTHPIECVWIDACFLITPLSVSNLAASLFFFLGLALNCTIWKAAYLNFMSFVLFCFLGERAEYGTTR